MKIIHFNQGQAGDLCINTVAARQYKECNPEDTIIMSVNKKYIDLLPLFYNHPHIDGFHVWDGYDIATTKDTEWLARNGKNIVLKTPMPQHTQNEWWKYYHQGHECCLMNGVNILHSQDFSCYLEKWFNVPKYNNTIAFAPFAGWYNQNNDKKLTQQKAQEIVNLLTKEGYSIIQIGGHNEPILANAIKYNTSYFDSMKNILGCELLITTDTWCSWYSSAYKFPTLGLYSNSYYTVSFIKNIQPINPNAIYLDANNVNNIPNELIIDKIKAMI